MASTAARSALHCLSQAISGDPALQGSIEHLGAQKAGWPLAAQLFLSSKASVDKTFQTENRVSAAWAPRPCTAFGLYSQVSPAGLFLDARIPHDDSTGRAPMIPAQCDTAFLDCNTEGVNQTDQRSGEQMQSAILWESPNGSECKETLGSSKELHFGEAGQSSTRIKTFFHRIKASSRSRLRIVLTFFKHVLAKHVTKEIVAKAVLAILVVGMFFSSERWAQLMLGASTVVAGVVYVAESVTSKRKDQRRWEMRRRRVVAHEAGHFLLAYLLGFQVVGYKVPPKTRPGEPSKTTASNPEPPPGSSVEGQTFVSLAALKYPSKEPERIDGYLLGRFATFMMGGLASEAFCFRTHGKALEEDSNVGDLEILRQRLLLFRPDWCGKRSGNRMVGPLPSRVMAFERRAFKRACVMLALHGSSLHRLIEAMDAERPVQECIDTLINDV